MNNIFKYDNIRYINFELYQNILKNTGEDSNKLMLKAIYIPTNENTVVLSQNNDFCEILINGGFKTVPLCNIKLVDNSIKNSTLQDFKNNIFISLVHNPIDGIIYSHNANRFTPEPHQYKPLIKILNSENNRILIADEVGLGKTIEAGMIYQEISKRERVGISLVVVPSSLTLKWRDELKIRFNEDFQIKKSNELIYFIRDYNKYFNSKLYNDKIIISYHTARNDKVIKELEKSAITFDFLIMDEVHTMRNEAGNTFLAGKLLTEKSKNIVFLSATPVQNKLEDLFNVLSLLDEQYFKDYFLFQQKIKPNFIIHQLINSLRNNNQLSAIKEYIINSSEHITDNALRQIFRDINSLDQLNNELRVKFIHRLTEQDYLSFIINRTKKKDVGKIIPRRANSAIIDLSELEQEYYNCVKDFIKFTNQSKPIGFISIIPERMASSSMIASLETFKQIRTKEKLVLSQQIDDLDDETEELRFSKEELTKLDNIITLGNSLGGDDSKFKGFIKILEQIRESGIKQLIVFSFFKKTIEYLFIKIKELGYKVNKIHGDNSIEDRYNIIQQFRSGDFDILLSSEVGSEGLDMQFCNVIVNYDLPWNPMRVEQRIGRIDRIGQKFDVLHIYNLCIKGSIEDRIFNRLYDKLNIFESSIGELEPILGELVENLNLSNLMNLTDEELDKKLQLELLASKRVEIESQENSKQLELLLNDDIIISENLNQALNRHKLLCLEDSCKQVLIDFLNSNEINYMIINHKSIKISHDGDLKKLVNALNSLKSTDSCDLSIYAEKRFIHRLRQQKEIVFSFGNQEQDFHCINVTIMHPIIRMILRNSITSQLFTTINHPDYHDSFAIVYRLEVKSNKTRSFLKVLITDTDVDYCDEIDYFEFIDKCSNCHQPSKRDFNAVKSKAQLIVSEHAESIVKFEKDKIERIIDLKIQSISKYYQKKIDNAEKQKQAVLDERVQRMREKEIDNLQKDLLVKLDELNLQRRIEESFEILGILEII